MYTIEQRREALETALKMDGELETNVARVLALLWPKADEVAPKHYPRPFRAKSDTIKDVWQLSQDGLSRTAISRSLGLSPLTVSDYLARARKNAGIVAHPAKVAAAANARAAKSAAANGAAQH